MVSQRPHGHTPFLYASYARRINECAQEHGCVALLGGRNLGKTTILAHLQKELGPGAVKFGGNGRSETLEKEVAHLRRDLKEGVVLIDDFDHISSHQAREAILALAQDPNISVCITACDPDVSITEHFDCMRLAPWKGDWESRVRISMSEAFGSVVSQSKSISEEILSAWVDQTLRLSGGHPTLVNAAFQYFTSIYLDNAQLNTDAENQLLSGPDDSMDDTTWRRILRIHLEDQLVDRALPLVRYILQQAQAEDSTITQQLLAVAENGLNKESSFVRRRLRETGLVYSQPDGRLEIVGELIKEWIPRVLAQSRIGDTCSKNPLQPSPTIKPARPKSTPSLASEAKPMNGVQVEILGNGNYAGVLKIKAASAADEVPLNGGPWRVVQHLREAEGEPVSLDTLAQRANLSSETAVRSAIQRLQKVLRENHLENVIDNVRGQGYRLSDFPKWNRPIVPEPAAHTGIAL